MIFVIKVMITYFCFIQKLYDDLMKTLLLFKNIDMSCNIRLDDESFTEPLSNQITNLLMTSVVIPRGWLSK